jgi:VanZ family protein
MAVRASSRGWLAAATTVSAGLILGAPYIGQLRTSLRSAMGGGFPLLMLAVVVGALAAAVVFAVARIRAARAARYGCLAAAVLIAVGYAAATATGNADVDAVERFHFVEYGIIAALFYRAWRPSRDRSVAILSVLSGFLVGTLDEWFQWFIPARVGEVRDVFLNLVAIASGLLFSLAIDPPASLLTPLSASSRRRVAMVAVVVLVVFGAFFQSVHLGYEIGDSDAGVFRSRYTAEELAAVGEERAARWQAHPPLTWSRLSREDQYMTEGLAHVQRRNRLWESGNVLAARHENLILERYYAPVLDSPSYISPNGHRWSPEQRADAEARGHGFMIYVSDALDYPVFIWPKWAFWLAIAVIAAVILRALWRPA